MSGGLGGRPGPQFVERPGLLIPVEDLPVLAVWLRHYVEMLARPNGPGAVHQVQASPKLHRYVVEVEGLARDLMAAQTRAGSSAASAQTPSALAPPAEIRPVFVPKDMISTAEAASILHVSDRRIRQLVTAGFISGDRIKRGGRITWRVDRASVLRRERGTHDSGSEGQGDTRGQPRAG